MATPVSVILNRTATILQDTDFVRWTVGELVDWANEVQLQLVTKFPDAYTKTVTKLLKPGARQYFPDDLLALQDIRQNDGGSSVAPCDRKALDRFTPRWMVRPTAGTVSNWMPDENPSVFYVYPAQGASPASLVITYSATPPAVDANGLVAIRDIYIDRLVNGILGRALQKDAEFGGDAQRAIAYTQAAFN